MMWPYSVFDSSIDDLRSFGFRMVVKQAYSVIVEASHLACIKHLPRNTAENTAGNTAQHVSCVLFLEPVSVHRRWRKPKVGLRPARSPNQTFWRASVKGMGPPEVSTMAVEPQGGPSRSIRPRSSPNEGYLLSKRLHICYNES